MDKKSWLIFGTIVIAFLGLIYTYSQSNKIDLSKIDENKAISASAENGNIGDHLHTKSNDNKVTLIEYGDFSCPACASMSKKVKAISEEYKDKITIVFRNFPIDGHPNSLSAAAAAESAGLQGKYFEMNEKLYENQDEWLTASVDERMEYYTKYAKNIGLDENKFKEGMKDSNVLKKINFDKSIARKVNVDATPTFILNGKKIESSAWSDQEKLKEAINSELK